MRSSVLKSILVLVGVSALAFAGIASFLVLVSAEDYRIQIINGVQKNTGAIITLAEPLQWQLWPLGIKLGKISLSHAKDKMPLLEAADAGISIQPLSILSRTPRVSSLVLDGASISINRNSNGSSNWDAVLKKLSEQSAGSVRRIVLHNSSVMFLEQGVRRPDEILITTLSLGDIASGGAMPLTAVFTLSHKINGSANMLSQNILATEIISDRKGHGIAIKNVRLNAEISSTLFPGSLKFLVAGDFRQSGGLLSSKQASVLVDYKNMAMADPLHASMTGMVLADFDNKTLVLNALQFRSLGDPDNTPRMSANIRSNWSTGDVNASKLEISTNFNNPLSGKILPLRVSANLELKLPQAHIALSDLAINAGGVMAEGQLQASVPALQRGLMPPQSLLQGMDLQGHLNSEALNLAALQELLGLDNRGMGGAKGKAMSFARFQTDIEGRNNRLMLSNLVLGLDKSTLHASAAIAAADGSPAYELQAVLDSKDITPVSRLFGNQELSGKMQASMNVHAQGEFITDLIKSAHGDGSVTLENGRLQGIDIQGGLVEKLGSYGSLLPALAGDASSNSGIKGGKYTDIISLSVKGSIDKGMVVTKILTADFGRAAIKGKGSFDVENKIMDYTVNLDFDKSLFLSRTENMQLPMQCQGNIAEEQMGFIEALGADCKTGTKAMNDIIAQSLIKRFSTR